MAARAVASLRAIFWYLMKRWRSVVVGGLVLLGLGTGALRSQQAAAELPAAVARGWDEVSEWLVGEMKSQGVVGASMYMTYGGHTVRRLQYGLADRDEGRPVDEATIFHWGSITKTLTAVAVMQLRDHGKLRLDDPIVSYVPELKAVHDPFGPIEAITLRHLLSHTSGFQGPTWPWTQGKEWQPFEPTRWSQLVAMFPYVEIAFEPGSRFGYSNPAFIYLAQVIERLTGDDYEVYVEKNVLRPLEMRSSYFDTTPYHLLHHRSNNYTAYDGELYANGLDFDTGITSSNGGLNASVPDLVRWMEFLLGHGPGVQSWPAAPDGVLARSSLEEMWKPVAAVEEEPGKEEWMGLSFFLRRRGGRSYVGHTGTQNAFASLFYLDPAHDAGVVAVFNTLNATEKDRPNVVALRLELKERLLRDVLGRFPAKN